MKLKRIKNKHVYEHFAYFSALATFGKRGRGEGGVLVGVSACMSFSRINFPDHIIKVHLIKSSHFRAIKHNIDACKVYPRPMNITGQEKYRSYV